MSAYIIDSDVLISAKNAYYAFNICPGFWDSLIDHHRAGAVHSIDRVQQELLAGREDEDLVQWIRKDLPPEFFLSTQEPEIIDAYREVMLWVQQNAQYTDSAKAKFATEADGWLAAFAKVKGLQVITNEQPRPESRSRILLPDVCTQFKVERHNTFAMLTALGVTYTYA